MPSALVAAFSYSRKVLLERHVDGRDLAVSVLDGEPLPVVEAVPQGEDFYDFEARYEIGRTEFVCPAELGDELTAQAQRLAADVHELLGCHGVSRVDMMLDRRRLAPCARGQLGAGDDGDEPACPRPPRRPASGSTSWSAGSSPAPSAER